MKRLTLIVSVFLLAAPLAPADLTVSGDVSGTWPAGEVVIVVGDIRVPAGHSLVIEPGVDVLFTGRFKFTVEGRLTAKGTPAEWITFTRAEPTEESKWRGFRFDGADSDSVLEYCHLEWAKGDGNFPEVRGGAVFVADCSPTFRFCRFNNNTSHNSNKNGTGGAIGLESASFSLIEHNHMAGNQADSGGAIYVGADCDPIIRFNLIEGNQAFNGGGGIYVGANAESTIHGNTIRGNTSGGWGGGGINLWSGTIYYGTYSHVYNNFVIDNTATTSSEACGGGGIYSRYDTSLIYNNTVAGNHAAQGGGMYVLTYSYLPPQVFNSVFWNNTAATGPEIYPEPSTGSAVLVTYCDVDGGFAGSGNIDADPLFAGPASGDFHLTWCSPCKNSGNSGASHVPDADFEGDDRTALGAVDMGADEYDFHLYAIGVVAPGAALTLGTAGWPTAPVILALGISGLQDPPYPTQHGDFFLAAPWRQWPVGVIPHTGVLALPVSVPPGAAPGRQFYLQALVGPWGGDFTKLTNLLVLTVE